MIASRGNIADFIAYSHLHKNEIDNSPLIIDVEDLIDLLKARLEKNTIGDIANAFLERIYNLRIEMILWMGKQKIKSSDIQSKVLMRQAELATIAPFNQLIQTVSNSLEIFEDVRSSLFEKMEIENYSQLSNEIQINNPTYTSLVAQAELPNPSLKAVLNWTQASLNMDMGLIIAELIFLNAIEFSQDRVESELIPFIKINTEKYGALSILLGFWEPEIDEHLQQQFHNMEILSSVFEFEFDKGLNKSSLDEIKELLVEEEW